MLPCLNLKSLDRFSSYVDVNFRVPNEMVLLCGGVFTGRVCYGGGDLVLFKYKQITQLWKNTIHK